MAIGIVSFAFVGIFALLPAGLGVFRQAMDTSIGAQIAQRIVGEIEQTDFDSLVPPASGSPPSGTTLDSSGNFYELPFRYFDDQGIEVDYKGGTVQQKARILYTVRVRGSMPGSPDPSTTSATNFTSLPASSAGRYHPRNVTILTVQVLNNPARLDQNAIEALVGQNPSFPFLIDPTTARSHHLAIQTYSAVVARNGYRVKTS